MNNVVVYTDGGCFPNPGGRGSWCFKIPDGKYATMQSGGLFCTTNNRMELLAVLRACEYLKDHSGGQITIISDSQYVVDSMNKWMKSWARKSFLRKCAPVKNQDLMLKLNHFRERLNVKMEWVRGHNGNEHNEACDQECSRVIASEIDLPEDVFYKEQMSVKNLTLFQ